MAEAAEDKKGENKPVAVFSITLGNKAWIAATCDAAQTSLDPLIRQLCKRWIYQFERGDGGYYHFQIECSLHKKDRPATLAKKMRVELDKWAGEGYSLHCDRASTEGMQALQRYAMKDDTRIAGPWADRKLFRGEDVPTKLSPFQQQIVDYCRGKPDSRIINWVVDKVGGIGKSDLVRYVLHHKLAWYLTWSNTADMMTLIAEQGPRDAYFFDLPRSKSAKFSEQDLYSGIEQIKNGLVFAPKWHSSVQLTSKPHVFVFANWEPDKAQMSSDRWNIVQAETDDFKYAGPRQEPTPFIFKPPSIGNAPGNYYIPPVEPLPLEDQPPPTEEELQLAMRDVDDAWFTNPEVKEH